MNYDPRLKECLARIEALCVEYDCGAYLSLVSKTHGEFRPVLPGWAAISKEVDKTGLVRGYRIQCKKEERERAELTAHFIHSSRDQAANAFLMFEKLIGLTKAKWDTQHEAFHGYRPHREEEN